MGNTIIRGRAIVCADGSAVAQEAAAWFCSAVAAKQGHVRVSLSGGSTPVAFYRLLASDPWRSRIDWQRTMFFWGDERFVAHDDADSNYRMTSEALLAYVPVAPENVHPVAISGTPDEAARSYETTLMGVYGATSLDRDRPLFDVMLLGLGSDGHTASLLPGEPVLEEKERWVAAVAHGRKEPRITLTYPALESSRSTAFLVTGGDKAEAVRRVRDGDAALPAGRLRPDGEVLWFLDRAAAGDHA
jgi:6-phosphogluconolactonase